MTLRTETIDPLSDPRWQRFVESSSNGAIFHHVQWLRLLHAQYGYPMLARCVTDEASEIVAGLPFAQVRSRLTGTRVVALPFSDMCPPLVGDRHTDEALDALVQVIRAEHERDALDVEIRAPIATLDLEGKTFYHHQLELAPDVAAVSGRFGKSVRRRISRAQRDGVQVRHETGRDALDAFYALHLRTRRRQGVPTQPKRFIMRFADLFERDLGFVLLACWEGETIAAAVFLSFNGVLTYKYGASSPRHLKTRPNNALFMEAVRWGCEHAHHTLDFGRTDLDNEGLRSFKAGWGARESELAYTYLSRKAERPARTGVPGYVKTVISRAPPVAGRLAGAALYKHFG